MGFTVESLPEICILSWQFVFSVLVIVVASMSVHNFSDFEEVIAAKSGILTNVQDMGRDWNKPPYIDVEVITGRYSVCKPGWE